MLKLADSANNRATEMKHLYLMTEMVESAMMLAWLRLPKYPRCRIISFTELQHLTKVIGFSPGTE